MLMNKRYHLDIKRFVCTCPQFIMSRFLLCKHLVQQFSLVNPRFFLKVTWNHTLPIWSHPLLKPLAMATDVSEPDYPKAVDRNEDESAYDRLNLAAYAIDDDDRLINTEGGGERTEKNAVKEKMEDYICIIQNFCNGLEYQLKFQDPQFLTTLEKDSAGFLTLAQNCLSRERWQNSSWVVSPSTWERSMANAMFYQAHPTHTHSTWQACLILWVIEVFLVHTPHILRLHFSQNRYPTWKKGFDSMAHMA